MKTITSLSLVACLAAVGWADEFEAPRQLTTDGQPIQVESPGYASPCLFDLDGDGVRDLLVGQFNKGKISVFKGKERGSTDFAAHAWLQAGGEDVLVPGVW